MIQKIFFLFSILLLSGSCGENQAPGKTEHKLKIAVIPKGTTHVFWRSIHAGAVKAARELDVNVDWQGPQKESDRQQQVSIVQNFISRKMDAIALAPLDSRSMVKVVKDAGKQGIPVIIFDSGLDSEDYVSFVATDNYKGGKLCARRLSEVLGESKKVILLRYMEGSASTSNREQGFLDGLKEYAPEAELISSNLYAGATLEKGFQAAQSLLNRFGNVDGIFCPNETSTQAMLRALQTTGRTGKVKLVGFDSNTNLIEGLKNGQIAGLAIQDPFKMGYLAVKTAVQYLEEGTVDKRIDTGVFMVTRDNMEEEQMKLLLHPPVKKWLDE